MRRFFLVASLVVLLSATTAMAQSQSTDMTVNIMPVETKQDPIVKATEATTVADVRFAQWGKDESYQIYDLSWVLGRRWEPRIVFREYFSPVHERNEREFTFGAGYRLINRDKIVFVQDVLLSHARTKAGERATFLQPTSRAFVSIGKRLSLDLAGFPYMPLGHGNFQWVLERCRATYKVSSVVSIAGGCGATELPGEWKLSSSWGMTLTPKDGKLGSFEFAYQGGFQFHYTLTGAPHLHHKKK